MLFQRSNTATVLFINGSHRELKYEKFLKMEAKQRLKHAKQSGLYLNCLQPFTRNNTCSKKLCIQCHTRHHTLLHIDSQIQSNDDKLFATNGTADTRGSSTAEFNSYCSFKGKPEFKFYLPLPSWDFRINLVNTFHAEHCQTMFLNHTS